MHTQAGDPIAVPLICLQKSLLNSKKLDSKENLVRLRITSKSKLELNE